MKQLLQNMMKFSVTSFLIFGIITVFIIASTKIEEVNKYQVLSINLLTYSGLLLTGTLFALFFEMLHEKANPETILGYFAEMLRLFSRIMFVLFMIAIMSGASYQIIRILWL